MPRGSRRERELYKYRPDDTQAQREAAQRMRHRRQQELREISEEFDGSLRRKLAGGEVAVPKPTREPGVSRTRPKRSLVRDVVDVVSGVFRVWSRKERGSHRG